MEPPRAEARASSTCFVGRNPPKHTPLRSYELRRVPSTHSSTVSKTRACAPKCASARRRGFLRRRVSLLGVHLEPGIRSTNYFLTNGKILTIFNQSYIIAKNLLGAELIEYFNKLIGKNLSKFGTHFAYFTFELYVRYSS